MNNTYTKKIDDLRTKKAGLDATIEKLTDEMTALITGDTIKERYESRKLNVDKLNELDAQITANNKELETINLAIKICIEMHAKQAANRFIKAVKENTPGLIDTPTHYKKYKAAAASALNEPDALIIDNYYTFRVYFQYYSKIGNYEITAFYTEKQNIISQKDAENATYYELIPAAKIEKIARDAIQDAEKVKTIYQKAETAAKKITDKYNMIYAVNIKK